MRPHVHTSLPLSFRTEPRRCPKTRYSAPAVAARRKHRQVCATFVLLVTAGPLILAAVIRWLAP